MLIEGLEAASVGRGLDPEVVDGRGLNRDIVDGRGLDPDVVDERGLDPDVADGRIGSDVSWKGIGSRRC